MNAQTSSKLGSWIGLFGALGWALVLKRAAAERWNGELVRANGARRRSPTL